MISRRARSHKKFCEIGHRAGTRLQHQAQTDKTQILLSRIRVESHLRRGVRLLRPRGASYVKVAVSRRNRVSNSQGWAHAAARANAPWTDRFLIITLRAR